MLCPPPCPAHPPSPAPCHLPRTKDSPTGRAGTHSSWPGLGLGLSSLFSPGIRRWSPWWRSPVPGVWVTAAGCLAPPGWKRGGAEGPTHSACRGTAPPPRLTWPPSNAPLGHWKSQVGVRGRLRLLLLRGAAGLSWGQGLWPVPSSHPHPLPQCPGVTSHPRLGLYFFTYHVRFSSTPTPIHKCFGERERLPQ